MDVRVTDENFNEKYYIQSNPDVAEAISRGQVPNARHHFDHHGRGEGRTMRNNSVITTQQAKKLERIAPILRPDLPFQRRGTKYDFLTAELVEQTAIAPTDAVSANGYDPITEALIAENADGLVLDCGAGRRPIYFSNVINFEIVDYDTTDVIGVGEMLPFQDNSIDAVISIAVLEHVRDPFACAAEIVRVLKPGGRLLCCVPFLQPEHGYPHHYYNMAPQGLRALFERSLQIDDHQVLASTLPIWSLTWMVQSWAAGLKGPALAEFSAMSMSELLSNNPVGLIGRSWVKELSEQKNFELASATTLFARKPLTPVTSGPTTNAANGKPRRRGRPA